MGTGNIPLATLVAKHLKTKITPTEITKFSDGEIRVEVMTSVRDRVVYVIQSTCAPTNDNIMELILITDALRRAGCNRVVAVIPYVGYARQDRRPDGARSPISAKVIAKMLESAGVDQIITVDIHSTQQLGFFDIPTINISAAVEFVGDMWTRYGKTKAVVVSPDVGGVARARSIAKQFDNADLAIIDKRRPSANNSVVMNVIGDVDGRVCIIVDDMVDTASTLCKAAAALKTQGAKKVIAYCTHGVLSGEAMNTLTTYADSLDQLIITDTIQLGNIKQYPGVNIRVLSVGKLLAEIIRRLECHEPTSDLLI
jgi:ribose-phosphate pyrophosphokinase